MSDPTLSGAAIDRLGDRLRVSSTISEEDLADLQRLRREFDTALAKARENVVAAIPGVRPTSRLKTVQTLVGKLRREQTMNLSQVQDVAGMRIVGEISLAEQDELAQRLLNLFSGARLVDRRLKPSFGYRAIHVIAKVDGRLVEIQIRTVLQDRWAQIVERLADHWGRQIRYGGAPHDARTRVGRYSRADAVGMARRLSPLIEQCERSSGTHGNRIQLSADRFCSGVAGVLALFARLDVTGGPA